MERLNLKIILRRLPLMLLGMLVDLGDGGALMA
jgi:hypothetical protein